MTEGQNLQIDPHGSVNQGFAMFAGKTKSGAMSGCKFRKIGLLASTALGTLGMFAVSSAAQAQSLTVSAPLPAGQSYSVTGSETWGATIIGDLAGESGSLTVGSGAHLTTGVVSGAGAIVGNNAGSTGSVTVQGVWTDVGNHLKVGELGAGSLSILNGGTVTANEFQLGYGANSSGTLDISGAGSKLTSTHGMFFSTTAGSTGVTNITNGGSLETVGGGLYLENGTINISGVGTTMRIGTLHAGTPDTWDDADGWLYLGNGAVNVSGGATIETDGGYVSGRASTGGFASMTVTGPGTTWDAHLVLYVGGSGSADAGNGQLIVSNGAQVTASIVAAGCDDGTVGTILLTGAGTSLTSIPHAGFSGNVYAGSDGDGTIIVQDGALLSASNQVRIGFSETAVGKLIIGAPVGEAAAAPGIVTTVNGVKFGDGSATLIFNHTSQNYEFNPVLISNNNTAVIRHLAGVTNLTGVSPNYSGALNVEGGTVRVNGSIPNSTVIVSSGAVLGGAGTVGDVTLLSGATIAPGNSIGTLNVANYTQQAGSTYQVELGGAGSDRIAATGSASLAGNVAFTLGAGTTFGTTYTILTATGTVSGTYSASLSDSYFVHSTLGYSAHAVTLQLDRARSFASSGGSANQRAVGAALDGMAIDGGLVSAALSLSSEQAARGAFDLLSGEINATLLSRTLEDSRIPRDAAIERVRAMTGAVASMVEPAMQVMSYAPVAPEQKRAAKAAPVAENAVWGRAFGSWGRVNGDGNAAAVQTQGGGAIFGLDGPVGAYRFGVLAGYGRSKLSVGGRNSSVDATDYHFGVYGGRQFGNIGARFGGAFTLREADTKRHVAFQGFADSLAGSQNLHTAQAFGELGYAMRYADAALEPFLGAAYVHADALGFSERGGAAALNVSGASVGVGFSTLGLRAEQSLGASSAMLRGSLAWRHAYGDVTPAVRQSLAAGQSFSVAGAPIARDAAVVEAALDVGFSRWGSLGLSYSGQYASGASEQSGRAYMKWAF